MGYGRILKVRVLPYIEHARNGIAHSGDCHVDEEFLLVVGDEPNLGGH